MWHPTPKLLIIPDFLGQTFPHKYFGAKPGDSRS